MKYLNLIIIGLLCLSFNATGQNITRANATGPYGLQVNTFTGNLYTDRTDLVINHPHLPLDFSFSYNSYRDSLNLGFGKGWTFPYSMCYADSTINGNAAIIIERPDGRKDIYFENNGSYTPPTGIFDELTEYESGKFQLREKYGMSYYFEDNSHKKLTRIVDENNNAIQLTYSGTQIQTITDAAGRNVSFTWSANLLESVSESNGSFNRVISYEYDNERLVKVINPDNSEINYTYNEDFGFLSKASDELGNEYHVYYKPDGFVAQISSCFQTMKMIYDEDNNVTSVVEKSGNGQLVTTYLYDEAGLLLRKTGNCCGFDSHYEYDLDNNVSGLTDANGNLFNSNYDPEGNLTVATDPAGNAQQYSYTGQYDRLDDLTDKRGNTFDFGYDANFNLNSINGPESGEIGMMYDANGNVTSVTDGNMHTTSYEYNALNNLTKIIYPDNTEESFVYDALGNLETSTDANNNTTTFEYDIYDRPVMVQDNLTNTFMYEYDVAGNLTKETDPEGYEKTFEYDAHYRLTQVNTETGGATYNYDAADNLTGITNANYNTWSRKYDKRGLMTEETDPLSNKTIYDYDANGNMTGKIEPNGNMTTYTYDMLNRLTSKSYPGNTDYYEYDANSNLIGCSNNNISISFKYDMENRLIEKKYNNWDKTIQYSYEDNGNRDTMIDSESGTTSYVYDENNRLTAITNGYGLITNFDYDDGGRMTRQDNHNGTYSEYEYDTADRLLKLENKAADNSIISSFDYVYDKNGNRTSITDKDGNITNYTYDGDNRLTDVSSNATTENYTFDGAGNRISKTKDGTSTNYNYDDANRITNAGAITYTFDTKGNMLTKTDTDGTSTYQYDGENRLVKITKPDGTTIEYRYDPFGNRLTRTTDGFQTETQYVLDGDNVLMELDETGNMQAHYTSAFQMDSWISMNRNSENYVYHKDGLGSTDALTNTSGSITNTYQYDSYGNIENQTTSISNPYTYTGREWDSDADMYYYRSRYYDAKQGRFITEDLFQGFVNRPLSLNKYSYVEGNPIVNIDFSGYAVVQTQANLTFFTKQFSLGFAADDSYNLGLTLTFGNGWTYGASVTGSLTGCNANSISDLNGFGYSGGISAGLGLVGGLVASGGFDHNTKSVNYQCYGGEVGKGLKFPSTPKTGGGYGNATWVLCLTCAFKSVTDFIAQKGIDTYYDYFHDGNGNDNSGNQNFNPYPDNDQDYSIPGSGFTPGWDIDVVAPVDPNEITGPPGINTEKWIPYDQPIPYTIYYENDPELATAPAQKVIIYHTFDEPINPSSFRVGDFSFGDFYFEVPPDMNFYTGTLDVKSALGVDVNVAAGLDINNNRAFWVFESIDPETGLSASLEADEGFLPVNDTLSHRGEGFVTFTVEPDPTTVQTGDIVYAEADIIFDDELPLITPPIFHTIDADHPQSEISDIMPDGNGNYTITWTGTDVGVGFASVDLYVSADGGPYVPLIQGITDSPFTFTGEAGVMYDFYTIGLDSVGLPEIKDEPTCIVMNIPDTDDINDGLCTTNLSNWEHLTNDLGEVLLSVNPMGNNLGNISANLYVDDAPIAYDGSTFLLQRHYRIVTENVPQSGVMLRLYLTEQELVNLMNITNVGTVDDLVVVKYSGLGEDDVYDPTQGGTLEILSPNETGTDFNANYIEIMTDDFGELWMANLLLPIQLIDFYAVNKLREVELKWQTANELNSDYYDVQRSRNGTNFESIGKVQAAGNSSTVQNYTHIDHNPLSGTSYYRLQQFDIDGNSTYSEIVSVTRRNDVIIYPNPVKDDLTIDWHSDMTGEVLCQIYDSAGKLVMVMNWQVPEGHYHKTVTFPIRQLPAGVYLIRLTGESPLRFVKE